MNVEKIIGTVFIVLLTFPISLYGIFKKYAERVDIVLSIILIMLSLFGITIYWGQ